MENIKTSIEVAHPQVNSGKKTAILSFAMSDSPATQKQRRRLISTRADFDKPINK